MIFASVSLNAHGSSLVGGSVKLSTFVDRSTYLAEAISRLLRLQFTARARAYVNPTDSSPSPRATDDGDNLDQPTITCPGDNNPDGQPMDMEEDPATTGGPHPQHKNLLLDTTQWQPVHSSKCRPPEASANSHATGDYKQRVVSLRLALRSASLTSR
jgi:hypothetical protein